MNLALASSKLQVKASPIHGYGVFAVEDIAANAIVEECYSLIHMKNAAPFSSFYFSANQYAALPLGYGCIYNHSNNPNACMEFYLERSLIVFFALRPIKAGEEICVTYGKEWFDSRNLPILKPTWRYRVSQFIKTSPPIVRFGIVCLLTFILLLLH